MSELLLHGRPVATFFDLLGHRENDMTFALGWGLRSSEALLRLFVDRVAGDGAFAGDFAIELQEQDRADGGFNDIELLGDDIHAIVEAKRGWRPPSASQLRRYENRLTALGRPIQRIVILTQNGAEGIVRHALSEWAPVPPIEACVVGWSDVTKLVERAQRAKTRDGRAVLADLAPASEGCQTCAIRTRTSSTSRRSSLNPSTRAGRSGRSSFTRSTGSTSSRRPAAPTPERHRTTGRRGRVCLPTSRGAT